MKQSDVNLANVIARGVAKALKETPITVVTKIGPRSDDMDVVEAAKMLKEYCEEQRTCGKCKFSGSDMCKLIRITPENWDI